MGDLVLGLLVLGAVLFAGVVIYNRVQERSARRALERAFDGQRAYSLAEDTPPPRREPTLTLPSLPDERVDYVIELRLAHPAAETAVREGWRPIELRFSPRTLLAGPDEGRWRAALQLVTRAGVVSEAELIQFRSAVETLGTRLGATISAPD